MVMILIQVFHKVCPLEMSIGRSYLGKHFTSIASTKTT